MKPTPASAHYPSAAAAVLSGWCDDTGTTPRQLALSAGLSQGAVARIIRGERGLGAQAAGKLAAATGLKSGLLRGSPAPSYGPLADTLRGWCHDNGVSGAELARRVGRSEGFKRILLGQVAFPAPALLDRLEAVTGLDLSAHRVAPDHTETLADVRDSVVRQYGARHEIVRDLERFARGLIRSLATVPALREAVEPELAGPEAHRRFGITLRYDRKRGTANSKRWGNFKRNLLRALEIHGTAAPAHSSWHLGPEWRALAERAKSAGKTAWAGISRLARVCDAAGISPGDVDDDVVALLRADLEADPRRFARSAADNRNVVRNTVKRWNMLAERFAAQGWPRISLSPLPHAGWRFATTTDDLSPALHAALDAYVAAATRPRPAARRYREDAEESPEPIKPGTAEGHRRALITAAKTLIDAGRIEAERLTRVEQLIQPEAVVTILETLDSRHDSPEGPNHRDRESSNYAQTLARRLHSVARRTGALSPDSLAELDRLARNAKGADTAPGVSAYNLERLQQFDGDRIQRFLGLPATLLAEVARERARRGAMDRELARRNMEAIALLVLRICPLRRANLGGLRWSGHFTPPGLKGPDGWLIIPAHETKQGRPIERRISPQRWADLARYMSAAQPLLRADDDIDNDFLFPSPVRRRSPLNLDHLSQLVAGVIRRRLDVAMHLHLVRHLYAWILLRKDRTALATVSRLLEHASTDVTEKFYAAFDKELCIEDADQTLDAIQQGDSP